MNDNVKKFREYLLAKYPYLKTIRKSFEDCSKYGDKKQYRLVSNETQCIDFDKLSEWEAKPNPKPKSADSLCFNDTSLFLIEFKSGDQVKHTDNIPDFIDGVSGKIKDSDNIVFNINKTIFDDPTEYLDQQFYLVVDSKSMGINPYLATLAKLSLQDNPYLNKSHERLFVDVLPKLNKDDDNQRHYSDIDVWYSEIFDTYLEKYSITDYTI